MSKKSAAKDFAPAPPRIIVAWHLGYWTAWFEDSPQASYGGDNPVVAVQRLFDEWQKERFVKAANRVDNQR